MNYDHHTNEQLEVLLHDLVLAIIPLHLESHDYQGMIDSMKEASTIASVLESRRADFRHYQLQHYLRRMK